MIEKTVIDYLAARLLVPVGAQTPPGPPESYVVVERTGGGEKDGLQAAVIALRCTAGSLFKAIELCNAAAEVLKTMPENVANVSSARRESTYNQTDMRTKSWRYTAIFRVYYMEAPSQSAAPTAPPGGGSQDEDGPSGTPAPPEADGDDVQEGGG